MKPASVALSMLLALVALALILRAGGNSADDGGNGWPITLPDTPPPPVRKRDLSGTGASPTLGTIAVVETSAEEDGSPGTATLQYDDGTIRRFGVRDWVDSDTRLAAVTDTDATFEVHGTAFTLAVEEARMTERRDVAPPSAPGIDFNAHPGKALPAIARRRPMD